jgi:acetate kinase
MKSTTQTAEPSPKKWSLETQPRYEAILQYLIDWMETHLGGEKPAAVGHRVVHGGSS